MKKILFLLLISIASYGQADFPEGVQISGGQPTVTTVNYLTTTDLTGLQSKIDPVLLPLSTATINAINTNSALKEDKSNKQNSLTPDGTGTKYATVDAINNALPTNYTKIVYVNNNNPNSATIFDLNNPPLVNDNSLKADVNNLYVGSDASGWVYNSTSLNYVTKTVTSTTSNFYLEGTTTDAGNSKTANIYRMGRTSFGSSTITGVLDIFTGSSSYSADLNALPTGNISFGNDDPSGNAPTIFAKSTNSIGLSLISGTPEANMTDDMRFNVRSLTNTDFSDLTRSAFIFVRGGNNTLFQILRNGNSTINGTLNLISDSSQLMIKTKTNPNRQLQLGYNLAGNYGYMQSIEETVNYRNLALNPEGANVLIGKTTDDVTNKLQVNGTISANAATTSNQVVIKSQLDAIAPTSGTFTPSISSVFTPIKSYYNRTGNILTIQLNLSFTPTSTSYVGVQTFTVPNSYTVKNISAGRVIGIGVLSSGSNVGTGSIIAKENATSNIISIDFGGNAFNTSLVYTGSITIQVEIN